MENLSTRTILAEAIQSVAAIPGFTTLIRILQTAGIIFIGYLIFLFIKGIIQYKKFSKIKHIDKTLDNINQTLLNIEKKLTSPAKQKAKK
jgi:hypothetical protein